MELWWNITDSHSASQPSAGHSYLVFEPSSHCRVRVLLERASSLLYAGHKATRAKITERSVYNLPKICHPLATSYSTLDCLIVRVSV